MTKQTDNTFAAQDAIIAKVNKELRDNQIRDREFDVIKRLQNGALELLALELSDTGLSDTITRGEVIADLEHRLAYLTQQVAKIKEYNEELKGAAK